MRRAICFTTWLMLLAPLCLPASDFDSMVREFSRESGATPIRIPFLGLARFAVGVSHPAGASDFRLAVFERPAFDGTRFSDLTDATVGGAWKPIIRVHSKDKGWTNIYMQLDGHRMRMMITCLEGGEATFVQIRLDPKALVKFIDEHGRSGR